MCSLKVVLNCWILNERSQAAKSRGANSLLLFMLILHLAPFTDIHQSSFFFPKSKREQKHKSLFHYLQQVVSPQVAHSSATLSGY